MTSDKAEALSIVTELLRSDYPTEIFGKSICFINKAEGLPFRVFAFPGSPALCVEYADNADDAELGRFEDGDRFYMEDYDTIGDFYNAIVAEIESD